MRRTSQCLVHGYHLYCSSGHQVQPAMPAAAQDSALDTQAPVRTTSRSLCHRRAASTGCPRAKRPRRRLDCPGLCPRPEHDPSGVAPVASALPWPLQRSSSGYVGTLPGGNSSYPCGGGSPSRTQARPVWGASVDLTTCSLLLQILSRTSGQPESVTANAIVLTTTSSRSRFVGIKDITVDISPGSSMPSSVFTSY